MNSSNGISLADVSLHRREDLHRYEAQIKGEPAATLTYQERAESIDFVHTETDERFRGQGLATRLAIFALDDAMERGKRIIPHCPFVADVVSTREEYEGKVDWPGTGA
ncbi:N-acetyltransferase [Paenarthrobacter sp. Z7-10]|uniref:GNAT family N-acetyltransferase n=1 Tax=Paenarthrobacter sp. Z7-10 TaxID=2787635 RepID=UPI0022A9BE29|nr:GNAT family N-acetyltransferase [Paenarthrobacter sp. Z7-10]MCZ2402462.1 N-acetyltransferase [Paenarthrobacter sp. Z7-10]